MTLKECYEMLHGDYDEAIMRLMNSTFLEKMLLKFKNDDSMLLIEKNIADNNVKEAFVRAHTLKGVAANFAFTELSKEASIATEKLRAGNLPDNIDNLRKSYKLVIDIIDKYTETKEL